MWGLLKEWLEDEAGCQIPDSDSLHSDLCGICYKLTSNSQLQMEAKKDMKKRGIRSPDEADALCLTFALPADSYVNNSKQRKVVQSMAQQLDRQLMAKRNSRN